MAIDLIGCYWTLAGNYSFAEDDSSPWGFVERVEAAAAAGYTGFGIKHRDLMKNAQRIGLREMRTILDANGMRFL